MRKILISLVLIFAVGISDAAIVIKYSTDSTPNPILYYDLAGDGPNNVGQPNTLVFDDSTPESLSKHAAFLVLATNVSILYMKHVSGDVLEMTAGEKAAVDAAQNASFVSQVRIAAKDIIDAFNSISLQQRAFADIVKEEINILRQRDRDRSTDVAAAISLADLKARWALRSSLTDRTLSQLKTAIKNRIDDGTVD